MDYFIKVRDTQERLWEARDKRVDHLPLMGSYLPVLFICGVYVYVVKIWGPRHMENRSPYQLRYYGKIPMFCM